MEIDKDKVVTQEDTGEEPPIDQVEARVAAKMKQAEGRAKERVGQGLQNEELEQEGRKIENEAERKPDDETKAQG